MQNTQHLPIGTRLNNQYEIIDVLGQGGFGIVYKVKRVHDSKIFAIKELFLLKYSMRYRDSFKVGTPNRAKVKETFEKVKEDVVNEVIILSHIQNRHIVKAYGYIEENNTIYSIMEYIEGINLENYLDRTNIIFDEQEAIELLQQIIDGLKEIHAKKIIHRDIKPSNIIKTDNGLYKLIDFTTSKTYSSNKTTITGIGSQGYAPPELEQTKAVIGNYSDIYSIGMTLFNLLSLKEPPKTGDRYFNETSFQNDIDSLDISDKFKKIIKKMTAMKIENRFQTLQEIEQEFNREEPPYLLWLLIVTATLGIGYSSYYLYDMLISTSKEKPTPAIVVTPPSPPKVIEPIIEKEEIIEEPKPKIKLLKDIEFDKNKMINNLEDRDILTVTKNKISFSFEVNRLISSKPNIFKYYNHKLLCKLKKPIIQTGIGITKKLQKQQFASKVALGIHGKGKDKEIHLVITIKDGYRYNSTIEDGNEIFVFEKD